MEFRPFFPTHPVYIRMIFQKRIVVCKPLKHLPNSECEAINRCIKNSIVEIKLIYDFVQINNKKLYKKNEVSFNLGVSKACGKSVFDW
jgi:hypothetical protein